MEWQIYLIGQADGVKMILMTIGTLGAILCTLSCIGNRLETSDIGIFSPIFTVVFLIILTIGLLVPDSKTISAMYLIPVIVENKRVQNMSDKGVQILEGHLDKWLEDLNETKQKEIK